MASAYKLASKSNLDSDSDMSSDQSSAHESGTVQGDSSSDEEADFKDQKSSKQVTKAPAVKDGLRNRILMLTSRGVSFRHRHLLADLHSLLPHTFKDTKLDTKSNNAYNATLNALADLHSCNYVFFFEGRKNGQDLYLWLAKAPNGPTVKFSVSNVHTMAELGFGGNCLKGGRGIVVFDKSFDDGMADAGQENRFLIRELLRGVFCVPSTGVRGAKPFVDRVIGIYGLDGKIWIRIYEIREGDKSNQAKEGLEAQLPDSDVSLVEVGPRFVLTPVVIQEGSFGGPIIYENKLWVSPNQVRRETRQKAASKYAQRRGGQNDMIVKRKSLGLHSGFKKPKSNIDDGMLFG